MMTESKPVSPGLAAQVRRRYENAKIPFVSTAKVREDVLALLEERKQIRRAAEQLMMAAIPYTGDPAVKEAVEAFRAALEGRAAQA